jgi:hypothetical protein
MLMGFKIQGALRPGVWGPPRPPLESRGNVLVGGPGWKSPPPAENGFNRIETPSEAYPETHVADSSLGLDLYFN